MAFSPSTSLRGSTVSTTPTFGGGPKLGLPHGMAVDVLDQDGLGEGRSVVDARAPIAVTAGTNLEEEGTVHLVFLRPVDPGEVPCSSSRHGGSFRAVFFLKIKIQTLAEFNNSTINI